MKDHPILFSAPMVRALLASTKTQTRRAVKAGRWWKHDPAEHDDAGRETLAEEWWIDESLCSYGKPGDRLWVREKWAAPHNFDAHMPFEIPAAARWHYAATEELGGLRWRPSIHMPRAASRITLEITDVRVERLQGISAKDIVSEGAVLRAHDDEFGHNPVSALDGNVYLDLRSLWAAGWDQINGPGSWAANPWVWAITFTPTRNDQRTTEP